jgi:hypothetical protein
METQALWAELAELRRQVEGMKKTGRVRIWGRRGIVFLVGLVVGLFAAQAFFGEAQAVQNPDNNVVVCKSLKLVDADGKDMLTLGSDADGGHLRVIAKDGKVRAFLAVGNQVGPGIFTLYGTDKPLVNLGFNADGGAVALWGKEGKQRVFLGSGITNNRGQGTGSNTASGVLNLFDQDGNSLFNIGGDADGGFAAINARDGKERVFLGIAPNRGGGLLNLLDTNGNYKVTLIGK